MAATIRFHLDEHIHPAIASGLRARGIDVSTTTGADLIAADYPSQLAHAAVEARVLVTHDNDFLRLHATGEAHAGIAYAHARKYPLGDLLRMLLVLHACYSAEEMRGRVEFL